MVRVAVVVGMKVKMVGSWDRLARRALFESRRARLVLPVRVGDGGE